jgi:hypothetical protein
MKSLKLGLLLAFVIIASGCTGIPDLFGGDVINVQEKVVENGERDVIIVKGVQTIPASPLLPSQQIVLSFILENRDNLEDATAYVDLFNAPTMREACPGDSCRPCNLYTGSSSCTIKSCQSGAPCQIDADCDSWGGGACVCYSTGLSLNERICKPDQCDAQRGCVILPKEEKPVNFVMKTPSEPDIKGIKTSTKLDFKTIYKFSSSLNYIVPAVSSDEITKRQRASEKIDLEQSKSYSSGPLQIDAQILGAPYMLSYASGTLGGAQSPESIITFNIRNRGSGTVVNSEIKRGAMEITFPPELEIKLDQAGKANDKFTCRQTGAEGMTCINDAVEGAIPLYRDESRSAIRFTAKLRQPLNEPFRSFQIRAIVAYDYELRNSVDVTINPFQNV